MSSWEEKFIRHVAERWVFQGSDPHTFKPRTFIISFGEDFLSSQLGRHKHYGSFYSGYLGGREVGYVKVPPGTVILEGAMRCLAFTRVDTVIGLGTCGALQPQINCGDIVVAESAQAGDCLSLHYGCEYGQQIGADPGLTTELSDFLLGQGLPVHRGPIVTTGAVFRETDELLSSWQQSGFLGVELEAASLFALANFMGIKSAIALLVTDSPVRQETSMVLKGNQRQQFVQSLIKFIGSPALS